MPETRPEVIATTKRKPVRSATAPQGAAESASPLPQCAWTILVDRIKRGDPAGLEDLYRVFSRGVRYHLCRQLGAEELEDRVHDTFLIVVQAVQRGELREPERLMGFVRTIVRRQIAAYIETIVHDRRERTDLEAGANLPDDATDPEGEVMHQEQSAFMEEVLRGMSWRDREILTRFYLDEQSQETICRELGLSETQFRLLKSRAKTRFSEIGRKKLVRRPIRAFFLRRTLTA